MSAHILCDRYGNTYIDAKPTTVKCYTLQCNFRQSQWLRRCRCWSKTLETPVFIFTTSAAPGCTWKARSPSLYQNLTPCWSISSKSCRHLRNLTAVRLCNTRQTLKYLLRLLCLHQSHVHQASSRHRMTQRSPVQDEVFSLLNSLMTNYDANNTQRGQLLQSHGKVGTVMT